MITLEEWMKLIKYRITDTWEHQWHCFGSNAHGFQCDHDKYSIGVVFSRDDQTVFEVTAHDYQRNKSYRFFHAFYRDAYIKEALDRNVDWTQAWDSVKYIECETQEDFLEKATAIIEGREYDDTLEVPLNLPDNVLLGLFKEAHRRGMTFNDYVNEVLHEQLAKMRDEMLPPHGMDDFGLR